MAKHIPKTWLEWISVVGSTGTLITPVAFIVTVVTYQSDLRRSRADKIRANLSASVHQSRVLSERMGNGSGIIIGAAEVRREFRDRIGPSGNLDSLKRNLNDEQARLSISVVGSSESRYSARLIEVLEAQQQTAHHYTGYLSLIRLANELYDGVVEDAYSWKIYGDALSILDESGYLDNANSLEEALTGISNELQSNVSLYYRLRYEEAVKEIDKLTQELAKCFNNFGDAKIQRISRASTVKADDAETITGAMKILISDMEKEFRNQNCKHLSAIVDQIQTKISKESAQKRLKGEP